MHKDDLASWLAKNGHDRAWLAGQLGCSKGTIDQWFSRGFPEWASKAIERLMNPPGSESGGLEVTFTAREFERIEEARKLLGLGSRKLFYEAAIREKTDAILDGAQTPGATKNTLNRDSDAGAATSQIALLNEDSQPKNITSIPPRKDVTYVSGKKKTGKKTGTGD